MSDSNRTLCLQALARARAALATLNRLDLTDSALVEEPTCEDVDYLCELADTLGLAVDNSEDGA